MSKLLKEGSIFWHEFTREQLRWMFVKHSCSTIIHPFCPESCTKSAMLVWKGNLERIFIIENSDSFLFALKIYIPLFSIPAIMFGRKKEWLHSLVKAIPSMMRSSGDQDLPSLRNNQCILAFLATLASSVLPISCLIRHWIGFFHPFLVFLGISTSSLRKRSLI